MAKERKDFEECVQQINASLAHLCKSVLLLEERHPSMKSDALVSQSARDDMLVLSNIITQLDSTMVADGNVCEDVREPLLSLTTDSFQPPPKPFVPPPAGAIGLHSEVLHIVEMLYSDDVSEFAAADSRQTNADKSNADQRREKHRVAFDEFKDSSDVPGCIGSDERNDLTPRSGRSPKSANTWKGKHATPTQGTTMLTLAEGTNYTMAKMWNEHHQDVVQYWNDAASFDVRYIRSNIAEKRQTRTITQIRAESVNLDNYVSPAMLHPASKFRMVWNMICMVNVIYDIMTMPLDAFDLSQARGFFSVMEWIMTVFWTIDMVLMFRTGYYVRTRLEMGAGAVAVHYLKTWFSVDLFVVVLEWAGRFTSMIGAGSLIRSSRIFRSAKFIKLLRLGKAGDLWMMIKERTNSNVVIMMMTLSSMSALTLCTVHIISCVWFWLGMHQGEKGWTAYEPGPQGDMIPHSNVVFWYVASSRWVIAQLNGRTDMDARRTMPERAFTCLAGVVLAVIVRAVFTSVVTKTMIDLSNLQGAKTRRKRAVNAYLQENEITANLMVAVKRHLHDYHIMHNEKCKEEEVLAILPANVQSELLYETRAPTVSGHCLFRCMNHVKAPCIKHLLRDAVQPLTVVNREVVFDKGDACTRMFFLHKGMMLYGEPSNSDTNSPDISADLLCLPRAEVKPGMWLSEAAIWTSWTNRGRCVADEFSVLFALEAKQVFEVIRHHPDVYGIAVAHGQCFLQQLAKLDPFEVSDLLDFEINIELPDPEFSLSINVIRGDGLKNADGPLVGLADPYCICQVTGLTFHNKETSFRTDVASNCLDPMWDHHGNLIIKRSQAIEFQVWDKNNALKPDTLMGVAKLDATRCITKPFQGALKLMKGEKTCGELHVGVEVSSVLKFEDSD